MGAKPANYTKAGRWTATTTAPNYEGNTAPHKDNGGNVLFNDGHVAWQNTLPSVVCSNQPVGTPSVLTPDGT